MEPFAVQSSAPGLIRPTIALQSDLSAVLREGRVLGGEVLQTLDGETLLIGVGRHRVPARTKVRMQEGHRFLFQVQLEHGEVVLRVLGDAGEQDSALLLALRRVVGQDAPVGELLQRLAAVLRGPASADAGPLRQLSLLGGGLEEHLFRPGAGAADLRARLENGGLAYEARLADVALKALEPARATRLASQMREALVAGLAEGAGRVDAPRLAALLRTALVELLGGQATLEQVLARWSAGGPVEASGDHGGELLPRDLEGLLERALARAVRGPEAATVHDNLHRAQLGSLGRGLGAFLLRALVGLPPAPAASSLLADLALLGTDLKGQLLAALGDLPEGAAREAVARTLAGLEAEQLLNLARGQSHEALHWSVAVPDGERWTTAHFFHRRADGGGGGSGDRGAAHRMTVAIDFTHTGPVRADLVVGSDSLAMRVVATRQEVADRMAARVAELEARLATGGRRVTLVVGMAPAEEVPVDAGAHDIRFLRDHHLMDTSG